MTRVLLIGSTGRLGEAFLSLWHKDPQISVQTLTRSEADLAKPEDLENVLCSHEFDVLLNAAAMTSLENCLDFPDQAHAINCESPQVMAACCREKNSRFVHFSTDYVFAGRSTGKKTESASPVPVNVYGKSKLAGEQAVLLEYPDAIVSRVSWLFGSPAQNSRCHLSQLLKRAQQGEAMELINDKFSIPTFTYDVVNWTTALLSKGDARGIYHLCNTGEPESWHSSAEKFCHIAYEKGVLSSLPQLVAMPISEAEFFREQRPINTAMFPGRLINEGIASPRDWIDAAAEYLEIR